ncbi:unnamed protein product [Caenorhabditis bovis]|uniref:Uncharacterized protein n=1 Tax=Caenorhabditis bovis TaxID=2654633 RepID=A0A8S1FER9_9PELO|nr:unnamed protein product [Caenorhabditis bovis]
MGILRVLLVPLSLWILRGEGTCVQLMMCNTCVRGDFANSDYSILLQRPMQHDDEIKIKGKFFGQKEVLVNMRRNMTVSAKVAGKINPASTLARIKMNEQGTIVDSKAMSNTTFEQKKEFNVKLSGEKFVMKIRKLQDFAFSIGDKKKYHFTYFYDPLGTTQSFDLTGEFNTTFVELPAMRNPFKKLSRSISQKLRGKKKNTECEQYSMQNSTSSTPTQTSIEEDPYREILRSYEDNISHLIYHGSSLNSMACLEPPPRTIQHKLSLTQIIYGKPQKISGDASWEKAQEVIAILTKDDEEILSNNVDDSRQFPVPPGINVEPPGVQPNRERFQS